jgi:hypothetical protein
MTLLITTSTRRKILALKDVAQRCSEHQLYEGLATSCPECLLPKQLQSCERVVVPPKHTTLGHSRGEPGKQLPTPLRDMPPS